MHCCVTTIDNAVDNAIRENGIEMLLLKQREAVDVYSHVLTNQLQEELSCLPICLKVKLCRSRSSKHTRYTQYRFQYSVILEAIRAGVGLGLGPHS